MKLNAMCATVVVMLLALVASPSYALTIGGSTPWGPVNVTVGPLMVNGSQVSFRESVQMQGSTATSWPACLMVAVDHGGVPIEIPTQVAFPYLLGPSGVGDFSTCYYGFGAGACFSMSGVFLDLPDANGMTTIVNHLSICTH